ncbi:hypothetical protein BDU57DRAFT_222011 [Ampelomyces quisqualis]|uniref:Uncharacterized protein n=1 Tax=Ampelomyces quisqualis TaxID=50730 RepID=A0A6A5QKS4_AMPQU|nr:hypothetical protein BDU57DRAFT_222011 [Ampelomyces quisqualis]
MSTQDESGKTRPCASRGQLAEIWGQTPSFIVATARLQDVWLNTRDLLCGPSDSDVCRLHSPNMLTSHELHRGACLTACANVLAGTDAPGPGRQVTARFCSAAVMSFTRLRRCGQSFLCFASDIYSLVLGILFLL